MDQRKDRCVQPVAGLTIAAVDHRNDCITAPHTSAQPSTMTNSSSLHGSEMTGGDNMTIPRPDTWDAHTAAIDV